VLEHLQELKKSRKVIGARQSLRALKSGIVKRAIIAYDADERIVDGIKQLCMQKNISIEYVDTMKQLGKECNIEVGTSVVCILKDDIT